MKRAMISLTEKYVHDQLNLDASGHDWFHIDRVRKLALHIAKEEQKGNEFIIEMAALLHDIPDDKLNEDVHAGRRKLDEWFEEIKLDSDIVEAIKRIINSISFSSGQLKLSSIEAEIVQDADRLDALGAIGIARTFAYGGKKGRLMYDPSLPVRENMTKQEYREGKSSSVHHFYEKLLRLQEMLNTSTAKKIASERHEFMVGYLKEFYKEWDVRL
ncbi:HD domain-containing protein [Peribacillus muralis]|uniref:HD domain-containing protein n=1 Tax=Peribacillus muralis TaxID=264697 RepID=UPI001F4E6A0C|nr:HD domain-containing protein [Peribacillus muralis]MCK1991163.1 HD domain-containing protein [Peribacillus muralis]MCK2011717.1 HD domain-containing protein [Peribacillus muralis]